MLTIRSSIEPNNDSYQDHAEKGLIALHQWRSNMKTLQQILSSSEKNTDILFDDLIDCILRKRRPVCESPEIDYIHRRMILDQPPLLDPRKNVQAYSKAHTAGYTAPSAFAAGYALAVEAGAEYEIALMKKAYNRRYSQYFDRAIWFDAHLNGTEEEHVEASANLLK